MQLELRKLTEDLTGFAHQDMLHTEKNPREEELYQELKLTAGENNADFLLACLRRDLAGSLVIPAGSKVYVLAKATADDGDIFLIVRSAAGIYAHVLDSLTEPE